MASGLHRLLSEAIYVLHAFQKNQNGASPPQRMTSTSSVTAWLRRNASTEKGRTNVATRTRKPIRAEKNSGNVFADLALLHPEQELLRIDTKERGQRERLSPRNRARIEVEQGRRENGSTRERLSDYCRLS